jgi:hypothetical protein
MQGDRLLCEMMAEVLGDQPPLLPLLPRAQLAKGILVHWARFYLAGQLGQGMNDRLKAGVILFRDQLRMGRILVSDLSHKVAGNAGCYDDLLDLLFDGVTPVNLFALHGYLLKAGDLTIF